MTANCTISASLLDVAYNDKTALYLENFNFSGNVLGVIGHNGAGKSTLLKSCLNLIPPAKGNLKLTYQDQNQTFELIPEDHMAFCPETGSVFSDLTVESYIKLWCRIKNGNSNIYKNQGSHYIELLDITPLLSKLGRELSKGQKRRVQTAIGFITKPKFFIFDEPFDGLDVRRTGELVNIIESHRTGTSFILSSHRMDVIERLADNIVVLKEGRVVVHGPPDQCSTFLAGSTFVVAVKPPISDPLRERMVHEFSDFIISIIGSQIWVTGKHLPVDKIKEVIVELKEDILYTEELTPSLTDAMSYFLRN